MKFRVLVIAILALIAVCVWLSLRPSPRSPEISQEPLPVSAKILEPLSPEVRLESPAVAPPRTEASRAPSRRDFENPLVPSTIPGATTETSSNTDAATSIDFDKISLMFRDFRTITGENPVGTNAEIMKAIMGGNPKGAMLGPPDGQAVNENGELIDRWGSPYFFHQLTKDLMEIRSAGPDRKMWSGDDSVSK